MSDFAALLGDCGKSDCVEFLVGLASTYGGGLAWRMILKRICGTVMM